MNLFTPERHAEETQSQYRARRALAKRVVRAMRCVGMNGGTNQRELMRNTRRKSDEGLKGRYGSDLMAHFANKNAAAQAAKLQRRALS